MAITKLGTDALDPRGANNNTASNTNVAVGTSAMPSVTGTNNTALGYGASAAMTSGNYNTAIGGYSLSANTSGYQNTSVGYTSLQSNTTGVANTSMGWYALNSNTTAGQNSAFGNSALQYNTTGANNTAVGNQALLSNTTASNNTAVGYQAGYSNTTGIGITAVGYQAGYTATTKPYNTIIGYKAGSLSTSAQSTFIGYQAGNNCSGLSNTFVGPQNDSSGQGSGELMSTGNYNTILGAFTGNQGGLDIRTASNYIVLSDGVGNPRGVFNPTGFIKVNAGGTPAYPYTTNNHEIHSASSGTDTLVVSNETASPYGLFVQWSGAAPNNTANYFLAGSDTTNLKIVIYSNGTVSNRTGTYNTISDVKLKENIVDATPKLDKLMQVKVRNYNLIGDELKQIGFVAQELETIFPSLIDNVPDVDKNKEPTGEITKGVKLTVMIPILVKAIQELKAEVDSLKQQLGK
jgi:hypothetical protein